MYCPFLSFAARTSGNYHSNVYCPKEDCILYNKDTYNCLISDYLKKQIEEGDKIGTKEN